MARNWGARISYKRCTARLGPPLDSCTSVVAIRSRGVVSPDFGNVPALTGTNL